MATLGTGGRKILVEVRAGGLESVAPLPAGAAPAPSGWLAVTAQGPRLHPWDEAHHAVQQPPSGLESLIGGAYAEPDFIQSFPYETPPPSTLESFADSPCTDRGPDTFWPVGDPQFGWHF